MRSVTSLGYCESKLPVISRIQCPEIRDVWESFCQISCPSARSARRLKIGSNRGLTIGKGRDLQSSVEVIHESFSLIRHDRVSCVPQLKPWSEDENDMIVPHNGCICRFPCLLSPKSNLSPQNQRYALSLAISASQHRVAPLVDAPGDNSEAD